jgi:hypothetical protein
MNIRIDYCSPGSCAIDLFEPQLLPIEYKYYSSKDELKEALMENGDYRVWLPKIERFEKWLKAYDVVADLGYLVFYGKEGRVERIVNIHVYHSIWLRRPMLRVADISEFGPEPGEED